MHHESATGDNSADTTWRQPNESSGLLLAHRTLTEPVCKLNELNGCSAGTGDVIGEHPNGDRSHRTTSVWRDDFRRLSWIHLGWEERRGRPVRSRVLLYYCASRTISIVANREAAAVINSMRSFWQFFYSTLIIPPLWIALHLLGVVNEKVRRGIRGRVGLFATLEERMRRLPKGKRVWFHSSSMGEFEQAKPIIVELKKRHPEVQIIVTFFSPSGYEHSLKYPLANVISYLPFDTQANASRFLDIVQPDAAVMIRYDVWPNHTWEANCRGIPLLIANATMHRQTVRRLPIVKTFHRHVYNAFSEILAVSLSDVQAFESFKLKQPHIIASGDTRHDQVWTRCEEARRDTLLAPRVKEGKKVFVVGSSWPEDEAVIIPAFRKLSRTIDNLLMILVPHEPSEEYLAGLEARLGESTSYIRYSRIDNYTNEKILIVDRVGILLPLYTYAHAAFIGGSFKQGIHNILEAAVFGIPVLFGPRHRNSQEPLQLLDAGGGFVVSDEREMYKALQNLLTDNSARESAGRNASVFVKSHLGATQRFVSTLEKYLNEE